LWQTIHLSRYLPEELKAVVDPVIQRNGYFGHPENMILALLTDDQEPIRQLGLRRLLKARKNVHRGIRVFKIPELNYEATTYIDLINWPDIHTTAPPLLSKLSDEEITQLIHDENPAVLQFPRLPCHTQAVERSVKLVTEASAAVCGPTARDGFIRVRLESRVKMPCFNTKKHYAND